MFTGLFSTTSGAPLSKTDAPFVMWPSKDMAPEAESRFGEAEEVEADGASAGSADDAGECKVRAGAAMVTLRSWMGSALASRLLAEQKHKTVMMVENLILDEMLV